MAADRARAAAVRLLVGVVAGRQTLSDLTAAPDFAALPPPDRARAQRLALATLRQRSRAEALLAPLLRREPPVEVRAILWLATVEMQAEGAPAHGVVNAAVALSRAVGAAPAAGMVNAVLRKVAALPPEGWHALPVPVLPPWLRRRLIAAWGKPAVQAIEAVQARPPPLDLTPRDGDAVTLAARLGGEPLPTGSLRLTGRVQVSDLPGYAEGAFWVQDAAAALAARALAVRPGELVADLCAAPGGKTLQLAAQGARVTAVDLSAPRLLRLGANLARTGLTAEVVAADLRDFAGGPYDAVLLDAPCSATGTIRRHPDLPLIRDGGGLADLVALQAALIDRAVALTRPGGRLVYCTCSLLPDEGEAQARAALDRHPDLRQDMAALALPGVAPGWIGPDGLRLRPDYLAASGGMDGFFIAAFRRAGAA